MWKHTTLRPARVTAGLPQVSGELLYNGYPFTDFVVQRTAAYVDQQDNHLAQVRKPDHEAMNRPYSCIVFCFNIYP